MYIDISIYSYQEEYIDLSIYNFQEEYYIDLSI